MARYAGDVLTTRQRPILVAAVAILLIWLAAWGGFVLSRNSKQTADKVADYLRATDLSKLSGSARAKALRALADRMNRLPRDERRKSRLDTEWRRWFEQMTEEEKMAFLDATLPTGFKQMIAAFEELPEAKRKRAVDDSIKRMREAREAMAADPEWQSRVTTNRTPELDAEMQKRVVTTGLKTFYGESSAQTKAELAPLLEEMQRSMESGNLFRGGPGPFR